MFTGIIESKGQVLNLSPKEGSLELKVASDFKDLDLGESIAVNGVCLTVAEKTLQGEALFFVSPETLHRTNLGSIAVGGVLNLERALTLQTRLSGHLVQGHVDGRARLVEIIPHSDSFALRFEIPAELSQFCIEKGSITLNGVSLTINGVSKLTDSSSTSGIVTMISIMIIPHTWSHTNLSHLKISDWVNVEVDVLAKYISQYVAQHMEQICLP